MKLLKQPRFSIPLLTLLVAVLAGTGIYLVVKSRAASVCSPATNCAATTANAFTTIGDPQKMSGIIDVSVALYSPTTKFVCRSGDPASERDTSFCRLATRRDRTGTKTLPIKSVTLYVRNGGYFAQDGETQKKYENSDTLFTPIATQDVTTRRPTSLTFKNVNTNTFPALTNSCKSDFGGRHTLTAVVNLKETTPLGVAVDKPFWRIHDDVQVSINQGSAIENPAPHCGPASGTTYKGRPVIEDPVRVIIRPQAGKLTAVQAWLSGKGVVKGVLSALFDTLLVDALPSANPADAGKSPARVLVEAARKNPDVDLALISLSGNPADAGASDSKFGNQHYLTTTNITNYPYSKSYRNSHPSAWDYTKGRSDVTIAVLDSGINTNVPNNEFEGQLDGGWDFSTETSGPPHQGQPPPPASLNTTDSNSVHGTQIAGIVAAKDNGRGMVGICPRCKIKPVKFYTEGAVGSRDLDAYQRALNYIALNPGNIRVVNISYAWDLVDKSRPGEEGNKNNASQSGTFDVPDVEAVKRQICEPLDVLRRKNILVVVSGAQDREDNQNYVSQRPSWPARCYGVTSSRFPFPAPMVVTSRSDQRDTRSGFADGNDDNGASVYFMRAPGERIMNVFTQKNEINGTSFASAQVSGTAGLVFSFILDKCPDKSRRFCEAGERWDWVAYALLVGSTYAPDKDFNDPGYFTTGVRQRLGAHLNGGGAMRALLDNPGSCPICF